MHVRRLRRCLDGQVFAGGLRTPKAVSFPSQTRLLKKQRLYTVYNSRSAKESGFVKEMIGGGRNMSAGQAEKTEHYP